MENVASVLPHIIDGGTGDGWDVLLLWTFDPLIILVVLIPGLLYANGLRRWKNRPASFARWRPYVFYSGLAFVLLALASPIDSLADDLFLFHMIQHLQLQMVGPPLILLGAPTTPVLKGMPKPLRLDVVRPLVRNPRARLAYTVLTVPVAAWLLFAINTWAWHFWPGAYDASLTNGGLHALQHFTFSATSLLIWWTIIDPKPLRSRVSYPFRMLIIIVTMFQNVALGAAITFRDEVLYDFYETRQRLWGISPLGDQQAGGAFMWTMGVMMLMVALVITFLVWWDKQEKKSRAEEAELDRLEVSGGARLGG